MITDQNIQKLRLLQNNYSEYRKLVRDIPYLTKKIELFDWMVGSYLPSHPIQMVLLNLELILLSFDPTTRAKSSKLATTVISEKSAEAATHQQQVQEPILIH